MTAASSLSPAELRDLRLEIEDFFYYEADLLDERRFDEWMELLADDVRYFMPIRRNVPLGEQHRENTIPRTQMSWFDEGKPTLIQRVKQLKTGSHWCEEPLSRVTHMITNVRLIEVGDPDVRVQSRFLVYRNRLEDEESFLIGRRLDTVRRAGDSWRIARREILLDQNVLLAKNLTTFF